MSSRRYAGSEVTYDDRRERDYVSRSGSRYDDRYVDQEVEFRRSAPPVRERERERDREEIDIRENRTRARDPPAFLREDYGRTSAGPVVLRARETEDFDFVTRPRRRSPSPEPERKSERESIVIRRDKEESESRPPPRRERSRERESIVIRRDKEESESRPPPRRERSRDREEIIIRRDERERTRPAPPPPPPPPAPPAEDEVREEIIIRREERSRSRPPPPPDDREFEKIIIRRRTEDDRAPRYEPPPPARDYDREEIIIRRDREEDIRSYARPKSRERERSVGRHDDSDSEHEVIIRRDEVKGRGRDSTREREEIIIRSRSRSSSRSPSPAPSVRSSRSTRLPPQEPQVVYAPQIHQEVITHHRHIDHGYELAIPQRPRPVSRPPSPPSPPSPAPPPPPPEPVRERSEERIEIRRSGERNGEPYDEDIIIDRNEGARSAPPPPSSRYDSPPRRERQRREEIDIEEDSDYYSQRALGPRRARMDGAAHSSIEISREISRPAPVPAPVPSPLPRPEPLPAPGGDIGRRYARSRDPKAGLWTEITKDLVVKEAIMEMGYEYEETDEYYYVIAYLEYDDVARLVGLSEDIRKDRRKRVKELEWESRVEPEAPPPPRRRPLAIEPPAPVRGPRSAWEREDDRYIEREVIYRGGRRPPPPGWRY